MKIRNRLLAALAAFACPAISWAQASVPVDMPKEEPIVLNPFEVRSDNTVGYRTRETISGSLLPVSMQELPATVLTISSQFIEDLQLANFSELKQYFPSAGPAGGFNDFYSARGFTAGMDRNGTAPGGRWFYLSNTERIEFVKGGNSVLYGTVQPGGLITFIPKRPKFTDEASLTLTYGTNDHKRAVVDVTGPVPLFGGDKIAVRLVAEYMDEDGFIDYEMNRTKLISPSITLRPFETLTVNIEGEYSEGMRNAPAAYIVRAVRETNGAMTELAPGVTTDPTGQGRTVYFVFDKDNRGLGREFRMMGPGSEDWRRQKNISYDAVWTPNEHVAVRLYGSQNTAKLYDRPFYDLDLALLNRPQNLLAVSPNNYIYSYRGDVLFNYDLGDKVKMNTIVGYIFNSNWAERTEYQRANITGTPSPVSSTFNRNALAINDSQFTFLRKTGGDTVEFGNLRVVNTAKFFDDRFILTLGASRVKITTTTKAGVARSQTGEPIQAAGTFRIREGLNIYAAYAENLTSNFAVIPIFGGGTSLPPVSGEVKEAGIKLTALQGRLTASLAVFDLTQQNIQRNIVIPDDPSTPQNEAATFTTASGAEQSKGVEYDLYWQVLPYLELQLNGTNFNGKVTNDPQLPSRVGKPLNAASENAYSFFATFRPRDGNMKGFAIGGGVTYASEQTNNSAVAREFQITDAATYVNAFARYSTRFGRADTVFALNVNNLLDEEYIDAGFHSPGRVIKGTVSFRF
jgi:iron complex outermembrane recepter protein